MFGAGYEIAKRAEAMELTSLGTLLRQYRLAVGLTQEALAARANLSTRALSDLERGLSRAPRFDTLELLTRAMHLSAEQRAALFAAARPTLPSAAAPARPLLLLPVPPTALIGRAQEVTRGLSLLRERGARLLTVTGPGGVGKTRLALQLAHDLRDRFADGLAWIDLTAIRDPALVSQVVAQTLRLPEHVDRAFLEQVRAFLQKKQFLLLFDNFEQVCAAADFVADLLVSCPRLQVLVTSRAPLHLRAERQLVLTPLTRAAAMALFQERAQGMQLGMQDCSPTVASICDQLDRLPLAIELAAAHTRVLSLPLMLERLANRLQFLRGGARDLPERQRTMQAAIAWSFDLLTPAQQRAFRALGIFLGGCTLEAAVAVGWGADLSASDDVLSTIAALVDASLVEVDMASDAPPRYRMLAVIREYALEQLHAAGEEKVYQQRHATYYADLAEEAERFSPAQGSRESELEQESANGRAALQWAYAQGETALGLRLAEGFGLFWQRRGQMREAEMWLSRMLVVDAAAGARAAPLTVRSRALYAAAMLAMHLGRYDRAMALASEELALAKRTGDQADISKALVRLGAIALATGKEEQAAAYFTESYAAANRAGGEDAQSLPLLNLGEIARKRGDFARASALLEEALATVRANEMTWGIANILTMLGHLARQQQEYARAKARYRESLALYYGLGNATYTAWCLEGIAAVAGAEQRYAHATRLLAAAAALRQAAQTPLPPTEQEEVDTVVMTARAELDERSFSEEWRIGSTMAQDEAIADVLMGLAT